MKRYRVWASFRSPLVVRRERQSQRSEGVQFVSGTLIRGAWARLYLQRYGKADQRFRRLFLDENACCFGPLDPAERIYPLTAFSCKREPGLKSDGKHGVIDLLTAHLRATVTRQQPQAQFCAFESCGQELKQHAGFWGFENGKPSESRRQWRRTITVHVGIDRHTHTAASSIFYTLPALEPEPIRDSHSPTLIGWIEAEEDAYDDLKSLLEDDGGVLQVGHARTRGYGYMRLVLEDAMPSQSSNNYDSWSERVLRLVDSQLSPSRYFLFTLSLPTGAILLDDLLRYTLDPAGMVSWLPPLPPPEPDLQLSSLPCVNYGNGKLKCLTAFARHERLRGWNAAHGLPRQDEWLVTRGALYAYLYEGNGQDRIRLQNELHALEQKGIGVRRNEGYGRVIVCDEFHLKFAPGGMS